MIWLLLALLAGASVVATSKPSEKEGEGGEGGEGKAGPLQPMAVSAPAVDPNAALVDQLVGRTVAFTRAIDALSANLPIAIGAEAAKDRAKVNESLALSGKAWEELSAYQVSFVSALVGDYRGPGSGSIERLLIVLQNDATRAVATTAVKSVMQSRPGYVENDWPLLSAYLKGAVEGGVPVYLGVPGQSVRGWLYGKESSLSVSPASTVKDFVAVYFPELASIDPDMAIKAVTGVIPVDSLPVSADVQNAVKSKIDGLAGEAKNMAVGLILKNFNPDELIKKYLPVPPNFKLSVPGVGSFTISTRKLLRVLLGDKLTLGSPWDEALRRLYPAIDADVARVQGILPQDVKNIVKLYLDLSAAIESSGGSTFDCVPRGFCKLVAGFDGLPDDQKLNAFTAFGRIRAHFASHAPVVAALGLLAYCSENWTLYSPKLGEMLDGSFEAALTKGLTSPSESAESAKARALRYRQFYTALVLSIATTTANDLGVPLYAWKRVLDKTWEGWDGGITGARDSGYPYPGASGVAFAYYFAERASIEVKKQLGL
jgi:hypothetical protein